jgi:hypothetical protein
MSRRLDERGSVLVTALIASVVLAVIGSSLMRGSFADLRHGENSQATNRSLHAAEAGINDYIAKLTQDHLYYAHTVHLAEATRSPAFAGPASPDGKGQPWNGNLTWKYLNGRDRWKQLPPRNDLEYDLQIEPPVATRPTVRIVATGRRVGEPSTERTLEAFVRTASIADFQMIANASITYGLTATTNGKIYAGNNGNIIHSGTANASLYAEGRIYKSGTSGTPTYGPNAQGYDPTTIPNIRSVIKTPIDFANFTGSIDDVERAAASGLVLDDPTAAGWRLDFTSAGTINVKRCTAVDLSGRPVGGAAVPSPTCGAASPRTVPANGAIYVRQNAIVSGTVKGRLTVATRENVVIGGDLRYDTRGVDVLGLMASKELIVPDWAPTDLTWMAATIAIGGQWRSANTQNISGTLTFTGSTATFGGGYMSQYATRSYNYDPNLVFLQPPYFPVLEDAYTIVLMREIP